jgi:RNA polymerase sigma-70 factor (ECF subfamily)
MGAPLLLDAKPAYPAGGPMGRAPASLANEALEHADTLFRLARRLTGSDGAAEDLVQETYARALGGAAGFEAGTNLRAWLFRILRNAFVDARRRDRKSPIDPGGLDDDPPDTAVSDPIRGDRELELLRGVVADDIEAALSRLPDGARTIVLLDLEGLTETELAAVLDCPVGTVKSRLARARAALRTRLRDYAR